MLVGKMRALNHPENSEFLSPKHTPEPPAAQFVQDGGRSSPKKSFEPKVRGKTIRKAGSKCTGVRKIDEEGEIPALHPCIPPSCVLGPAEELPVQE